MKGLVDNLPFIVLTVIVTIVLLNFMLSLLNVDQLFMRESIELSRDRVETAVYGLSALEKARMEIEFNVTDGLNFTEENGKKFVSYTYRGETDRARLRTPYGISYDLLVAENNKVWKKICLTKSGGSVTIEGGECEWTDP